MESSGSDTAEREALGSDTGAREAVERDTDERTVWLDTGESEALDGDAVEPEATERDTTDEWRIEAAKAPATVAELEERIDVALVTAQSAEEAALEIGAASLEAAEQARRAAAIAERAGAAASRAASDAASAAESAARTREAAEALTPSEAIATAEPPVNRPASTDFIPRPKSVDPRRPDPFEERITAFRLRAEKVMIRLQKLEAGAAPGDGPSEVVRLR
jgi:hypothetical protein